MVNPSSGGKKEFTSRHLAALRSFLPVSRIKSELADRLAFSADASIYSILPSVVLFPENTDHLCRIIQTANLFKINYTFRTAGTSLSGQAVTDGWLIVLTRGWNACFPDTESNRVTVQPGITGEVVNRILKPNGRKIGPDPASIHAAMMGGILANNASGMCCGVSDNAYHTLDSLQAVLPGGSVFDSSEPIPIATLETGLIKLRDKIRADSILTEKIRSAFRIKNTLGYSLNAFIDFEKPEDILARLFIGSEGTLGAITSATLRTIPDPPNRITALFLLPGLAEVANLTDILKRTNPLAIELMDGECIRVFRESPFPWSSELKNADRKAAVLLAEWDADSDFGREKSVSTFFAVTPLVVTTEDRERQYIWNLRKGLFPSVGAARAVGTSVIIEDVAVPAENFGTLTIRLRDLLDQSGFPDAIIFGHARDGNLHFVISQDFSTETVVIRYQQFINDLVRLVVGLNGSLKAEHGTGRNMAPFLETAWGPEAVSIMKDVKALLDPLNLCNPGVILNPDSNAHLKNLKTLPPVDAEIDSCIECGFCEPVCPSNHYTVSPRQRIVLMRAQKRNPQLKKEIHQQFQFSVMDTCATDGLCALHCPVGIDTGKMVKKLRLHQKGRFSMFAAERIRKNFKATESLIRAFLPISRFSRVPFYAGKPHSDSQPKKPQAIWFQTCISRTMGGFPDGTILSDVIKTVLDQHEISVKIPDTTGLCCGMPFFSKGFQQAGTEAWIQTINQLYNESDGGTLPVLVDNSPCAQTLKTMPPDIPDEVSERFKRLVFMDSPEFIEQFILPVCESPETKEQIWLHVPCSVYKTGILSSLTTVAQFISDPVNPLEEPSCCGMAGDRGIFYPALMDSAQYLIKRENKDEPSRKIVSTSLTCGCGIAATTGNPVLSIWHLFAIGKY